MSVSGPVWLVGMMGAGKSRVGRALARRLRLAFTDTDAEIEREAGASVAEIFERHGEAEFRARERAAVLACGGGVVALGGGALAQPEIAEHASRSGTIVYLRARPETLLRRVGAGGERPLLAGLDEAQRLARLRSLLAEREAVYAKAGVCVDTDESNVEDVVDEILERLGAA